jgi:putative transposase
MSEKYKIRDQSRQYFITFATAGWIDVFTRRDYKDIFLESVRYCQREKGLVVYAWCLMTNHVHMIIGRAGEAGMEEIIRDLKKFTATQICKAIEIEPAGKSQRVDAGLIQEVWRRNRQASSV